MSASFTKLATVTASTTRSPAVSSGKIGAKVTNIVKLKCTPIDPLDPKIAETIILESPATLLITYCEAGLDIQQGDTLVVDTESYPIKSVSDWAYNGSTYLELILIKYRK